MVHAAESMHWYDRDGKPCYTVVGANGKERPTNLRDARKLGYVPSVTEIIKCCAKPGLERWKLDQMLHAALTLPRIDGEQEAQWLERVWADSKETARKAAERGTELHAAIQGHYEGEAPNTDLWPYVQGAVKAVRDWADVEWAAEMSFASSLGFGGKVDLSSQSYVADFKTKEFYDSEGLKTWDEHAMQLSAYRVGLGIQARCAIVYVSTTRPGLAKVIELTEEELKKGWRMFSSLLSYWKAKNNLETSFERLAA